MGKTTLDYDKIYDYLISKYDKIITASGLAYAIGENRIYGGTMAKLVREGYLIQCESKGFYRVIRNK